MTLKTKLTKKDLKKDNITVLLRNFILVRFGIMLRKTFVSLETSLKGTVPQEK